MNINNIFKRIHGHENGRDSMQMLEAGDGGRVRRAGSTIKFCRYIERWESGKFGERVAEKSIYIQLFVARSGKSATERKILCLYENMEAETQCQGEPRTFRGCASARLRAKTLRNMGFRHEMPAMYGKRLRT